MKNRYIDSLLSEIQLLESKVANLKKTQHVSFSFFKESFKRTQEISRLLHELEFVQIEDMKGQMERLVQFLSEAKEAKDEVEEEDELMPTPVVADNGKPTSENEVVATSKTYTSTYEVEPIEEKEVEKKVEKKVEKEIKEDVAQFVESKAKTAQEVTPATSRTLTHDRPITPTHQATPPPPVRSILNQQKETIVENLGVMNKSLNDVLPVNHTIQDAKRSISLNDRFLFQRELFDNNRETMNAMMANLQPFTSFDAIENYLKENTNWNFKDETVDKFMQMLKDSFT